MRCRFLSSISVLLLFALHSYAVDIHVTDDFDAAGFREPAAVLWPGYFWLWNGPLEPDTLRTQLRDMAAHGARSVCMLPMPHAFRPDSTNNEMDPDYLTPAFFDRVKIAVEEAARLGMHWWLYDEGGWPSGQALGKVLEGHPELAHQRLVRESVPASAPFTVPSDAFALVVEGVNAKTYGPGETWNPASADETAFLYRVRSEGRPDLMNPDATRRFITLTHDAYRQAIGAYFGSTVGFTFTDEPGVPNLDPPKSIPWSSGLDAVFAQQHGKPIFDVLPELFLPPGPEGAVENCMARIDFYDTWTSRFRDAYFGELQSWAHANRLGSGGHLNGEDETVNAVRYGFGQALRQLRAMDMPGVDVIWRQLFPGKPSQHHFPKYASSAAHQNGTRYAFTESFCVYGNGLTPAQMKWILDYQYVRGINVFVGGCYPLSTHEHHMTGERPHFGPVNPLWDHFPGFHAYAARLGYALSSGKPKISTALYYPVRDLWARGESATDVVQTHDLLAQGLLEHQCDFDLIDDDLLRAAAIENGCLAAGAMRYGTVVCGITRWMHPEALDTLARFAAAGGRVLCAEMPAADGQPGKEIPGFRTGSVEALAAMAPATVSIDPPFTGVRVAARTVNSGELLLLFNEGDTSYAGIININTACAYRLDPQTGRMFAQPVNDHSLALDLVPGETRLLLLSDISGLAEPMPQPSETVLALDTSLTAMPYRRFSVGEHDFENTPLSSPVRPFSEAAHWRDWLGEDFSGEVEYAADIELPSGWANTPMQLETGSIEYAATAFWDGKEIGNMLWAPWQIALPPSAAGTHRLCIRAANTLANELTSARVAELWRTKQGPGWPSPYHERALKFEAESRGGGIQGPILLRRMN